jgi:hypothetical protein
VKLLADTGALLALFNPRDTLNGNPLALDGSFTFDRNFRDCGFTVYPDRKGK